MGCSSQCSARVRPEAKRSKFIQITFQFLMQSRTSSISNFAKCPLTCMIAANRVPSLFFNVADIYHTVLQILFAQRKVYCNRAMPPFRQNSDCCMPEQVTTAVIHLNRIRARKSRRTCKTEPLRKVRSLSQALPPIPFFTGCQ